MPKPSYVHPVDGCISLFFALALSERANATCLPTSHCSALTSQHTATMSDAWGNADYDDDDSNPFGRSSPPARGGAQQAQQQDYRTTDDYLREAIGNLVETEDMGGEALAHLAAQREMLDNMQNNVRRMDNTLDVADRKIAEMENPWAIGPVKVKSTGKHQGDLGGSGAGKVLS